MKYSYYVSLRIVLLSQARTEALLSRENITGLNHYNLNIEEIRRLRAALDLKDRRRIRDRDKVLGFIIGMIIPIGLLLYITLNISCRLGETYISIIFETSQLQAVQHGGQHVWSWKLKLIVNS